MRELESQFNQKSRDKWNSLTEFRESSVEVTTWDDLGQEVPFAGDEAKEVADKVEETVSEVDDRISSANNRVVEGYGMYGLGRNIEYHLETTEGSVYRVTGLPQIDDIIACGYVRPKRGKTKGGGRNVTYWSHGCDKLFYYDKRPVIQASFDKVKDGQIGAVPLSDLEGIYFFDEKQQKYINRIDEVREQYNALHQDAQLP